MPQDFPLVILGATNVVAPYLFERLASAGYVAEVISRKPAKVPDNFTLTQMDLTTARNWIAPEGAVVLSLLPLWLLTQFLPRFIGVKAIIAVGSTSLFSKAASPSEAERKLAADLENAEGLLREWCRRSLVQYTLLRPTLIYDGINDKNIARMAKFIRRFHGMVLAAPAKGLRQPIHADDVAKVMVASMNNHAVWGKALNIAGGEVLTYREMVERVFAAIGQKPQLLSLPTIVLTAALHAAQNMGLFRNKSFDGAIFHRMNEDLVFDVAEGLTLLDYQPRGFKPNIP